MKTGPAFRAGAGEGAWKLVRRHAGPITSCQPGGSLIQT
jgi:hypothetical protein